MNAHVDIDLPPFDIATFRERISGSANQGMASDATRQEVFLVIWGTIVWMMLAHTGRGLRLWQVPQRYRLPLIAVFGR
jgi:hypothetical protein